MDPVRNQYERFPYPPIPFLALPRRDQGAPLRYPREHEGIRILVAGCGTLEAAIVAQAHPRAREIVAVDLSTSSLAIAKRRLRWMRLARPFSRIAPVHWVDGDVARLELGEFDYVLASNLLQHSPDPAGLLSSLSGRLRRGGALRAVTYPKGSRYWIRKTSEWLRGQGLGADSRPVEIRRAIRFLPMGNPIRSCFDSQPEAGTRTGLVDTFFNACENPLSPLEWERAAEDAGLRLIAEGQDEGSRPEFLDEFLGKRLSAWERLQILDDTWELCVNPIFWFEKARETRPSSVKPSRETLGSQLRRAERLLEKAGKTLADYQAWLQAQVGPRVNPTCPDELLRGLSITEYELADLLSRD